MVLNLRYFFIAFSLLSIAISFWLFSRFTVDDAFITWRYGQNLIDFGIWNYNPSTIDLTQAYTNPIFAILSIVPAYLGIDVVLFFKLFSVFVLISFFIYFYKKTKSLLMILMAYAVPATFIHAFSGLETFLFVALLVALFISLDENKPINSFFITILLILTRPESYLLIALTPSYFLLKNHLDNLEKISNLRGFFSKTLLAFKDPESLKKFIIIFTFISIFLFAYFSFHKIMFGFALPNTFYVKAGGGLNPTLLILTIFTVLTLSVLILSKRITLLLLFGGFFFLIGIQYSTSSLQMNYVERFLFHILMPIYFILIYVASKNDSQTFLISDMEEKRKHKVEANTYINVVAFCLLTLITLKTLNPGNLLHVLTYYPRALDSHAELGKALYELKDSGSIQTFSLGDAGMAAYHSKLNAFDNIGLGSSLLAQNGISNDLLDLYNPQVVAFHARLSEIRLNDYNQSLIKKWVDNKGYNYVCDIYWKSDYTLKIYAVKNFEQIKSVCINSKEKNDIPNRNYAKSLINTPFHYWHD